MSFVFGMFGKIYHKAIRASYAVCVCVCMSMHVYVRMCLVLMRFVFIQLTAIHQFSKTFLYHSIHFIGKSNGNFAGIVQLIGMMMAVIGSECSADFSIYSLRGSISYRGESKPQSAAQDLYVVLNKVSAGPETAKRNSVLSFLVYLTTPKLEQF